MLVPEAEELKAKGNAAFGAGSFQEAVEHFSEAIKIDASNHVYFSNRSAAYASLRDYRAALADAQKTVELKPDWARGYSRLGAAYYGLDQLDDAAAAYSKGQQLDPSNQQLKQGLADVMSAQRARASRPAAAAAGPAGDRAGSAGQLVLLFAHAVLVLSALASLQPLYRALGWQAYFLFCRTSLVLSMYKVYLRHGLPPLRPFPAAIAPWMRRVAASTQMWHLMLSSMMMQTPAIWMGVVPLALQAALELLPALGSRFGGHPLWRAYGARAAALLDANKLYVLQFVATAEIGMGFQMALAVLQRGLRGAMLAYLYWNQLRMRLAAPDARPYHQQAWAAIGAKAQPLLGMLPALRPYVDRLQAWFTAPSRQAHQHST